MHFNPVTLAAVSAVAVALLAVLLHRAGPYRAERIDAAIFACLLGLVLTPAAFVDWPEVGRQPLSWLPVALATCCIGYGVLGQFSWRIDWTYSVMAICFAMPLWPALFTL